MTENNEIEDFLGNDPEMIECFVDESRDCLITAKSNLIAMKEAEVSPGDDNLEEAFRSVHSIKSSAGFLNLEKLVKLALISEEVLNQMRKGKIRVEGKTIDPILQGISVMDKILQDIKNIEDVDTEEIHSNLSSLLLKP